MAVAMAFNACSDDTDELQEAVTGESPSEIVLTLQLPGFDQHAVGSRTPSESAISELTVIGYRADGSVSATAQFSGSQITTAGSAMKVRVSLPNGTNRIEAVANANSLFSGNNPQMPASIFVDSDPNGASSIIMWGRASLSSLLGNNCTIGLTRQTAKVAVSSTASGFSLTGMKVCGTAVKGSVAPRINGSGSEQMTTDGADPCTRSSSFVGANTPVYVYETPSAKPYIILKGLYDGRENFYKVALYWPGTNNRVGLFRNHYYVMTVTAVEGAGYSSEQEAAAGGFSNCVVTRINDYNEGIYNIVSANNYALGVCDTITVQASDTYHDAQVVVLSDDASILAASPSIEIPSECSSWIKGYAITRQEAVPADVNYQSPGKLYTVRLTLAPNVTGVQTPPGKVTVHFLNLSREIPVYQLSPDFRRSPDRRATLLISGSAITDDYYGWLDNTVKGVLPEQNMGRVRNEGLHFSSENGATFVYRIPFKSGDQIINKSRSDISVTQSGGYWEVKLTGASSAATTMWIGSFTIKTADGAHIVYPVYRTGIFHQITSTTYQVPSEKVSGWYYYETVAVTGKSGKTYYMLDRNIGAQSDGPFSLATAALSHESNSIGAYFKISNAKGDNIRSAFCPAGFTVPTSGELSDIGFSMGTFSTYSGERYNSATKTTNTALCQVPRVFLPTGGYTEGDNYKNSNHANVWSSTYLSGAQGFASSSPEYKFWFLYLDAYGSKVDLSNTRFVSGGAGQTGSIFKGMPVRCVRSDGTVNPPAPQVLYWNNSGVNWAQPKAYFFNSGGDVGAAWPGSNMTFDSGTRWKIAIPDGATGVVFNNGSGSQTYDITFTVGATYGKNNLK